MPASRNFFDAETLSRRSHAACTRKSLSFPAEPGIQRGYAGDCVDSLLRPTSPSRGCRGGHSPGAGGMKAKVSPTIVGAFVIGAMVLGVVALFAFGGVNFFAKPQRFVVYFDESVHGLD